MNNMVGYQTEMIVKHRQADIAEQVSRTRIRHEGNNTSQGIMSVINRIKNLRVNVTAPAITSTQTQEIAS